MNKKIIHAPVMVLGASAHAERYSYMAVQRLFAAGYTVIPVGRGSGTIGTLDIHLPEEDFGAVDTLSIYINPNNQAFLPAFVEKVRPRRLIFNPGAENAELERKFEEAGIQVLEACTLVLLSTGQF